MRKKFNYHCILFCILNAFIVATYAQSGSGSVWVSDKIEAPLRETPELNSKIITLLSAGQRVTALDQNQDYVKIKTIGGTEGWLSNYYVLRSISVHEQLAPMKTKLSEIEKKLKKLKKELANEKAKNEQLTNSKSVLEQSASEVAEKAKNSAGDAEKLTRDKALLEKKLLEQSKKMSELATALDEAKQKASNARTRYLSLVKVSENVVDIDKQNRSLQEKAVQFETQVQNLKNENQSLKAKLDTRQAVFIALLIFGGIVAGYVLSILTPPRGRRSSGSYSSF